VVGVAHPHLVYQRLGGHVRPALRGEMIVHRRRGDERTLPGCPGRRPLTLRQVGGEGAEHRFPAGVRLAEPREAEPSIPRTRSTLDELADWTVGQTASSRSDAGYPSRRASTEMLMTPQVVVALTAWSDRNR
jgi:hypothetical protein